MDLQLLNNVAGVGRRGEAVSVSEDRGKKLLNDGDARAMGAKGMTKPATNATEKAPSK